MTNAAPRADVPSDAELTLAAEFIREPVLLGDEDASVALAHGTARRRAIDQALAEQSEGLPAPSTAWRRRWSLLLGLERMLSVEEPTLADGTTTLGPHQVDALSGTLTALLTENQASSAFVPAESPLDKPIRGEGPSGKEPRTDGSGRSGDAKRSGEPKAGGDAKAKDAKADDETKAQDAKAEATAPRSRAAGRRAGDAPESAAAAAPADTVVARSAPAADAEGDEDDYDEDYDDEGVSGEGSDVHGPSAADLAPTADELAELDAIDLSDESEPFDESDADQLDEQEEDPNAAKRFWFEHATGAGKTVAAMGFVDACRLGGVLILTHRRNLVEQFIDEIKTRGYKDRLSPPLLKGEDPVSERNTLGPVTVETYQWFVRHAGEISSAYTIVICDEAHTALGEKTSAAIRAWTGPIFIGMTATGALIARHVADLFPTQTSRFDLAQAARRGVIAPLRCIRIPPGVGVRTIAKVPLRRGEVDMEFDQEMLAEVLDQLPFNLAAADLYKTRFGGMAGVVYAAGVKHAYNLADAFNEFGIKAKAVSGETPKRELSRTLADYEAGKIDVLINAQLLAEGWNSPRATVCLHLAPTASKRIYQQRVGRVTRREPGKEAGLVVDFVHPGTKHDDPVVTLHSLLERDVYRGGAIVVGPVRRGRGRKVRVERRVLPVASDETTRIDIFGRELWRIAVEYLDYGEQVQWAALAGASVSAGNWRKARAMLHFDRGGELKRAYLVTALKRNPSQAVKLKAVADIAALRDPEAFADAADEVIAWNRADRRDAVRVLLQSIADKPVGRRDQATAWIWQLAEATADEHEEYATQRWKEGKRLLGLLVNSAGPAHGRNARRLVQATREQDRRLQAAMLASARPHTPEAQQVITGARTRLARKPGALARELLRNIPKAAGQTGGGPSAGAKAKGKARAAEEAAAAERAEEQTTAVADGAVAELPAKSEPVEYEAYTFESEAAEHAAERGNRKSRRSRSRNRKKKGGEGGQTSGAAGGQGKGDAQGKAKGDAQGKGKGDPQGKSKGKGGSAQANGSADGAQATAGGGGASTEDAPSTGRRRNRGRSRRRKNQDGAAAEGAQTSGDVSTEGAQGSGDVSPEGAQGDEARTRDEGSRARAEGSGGNDVLEGRGTAAAGTDRADQTDAVTDAKTSTTGRRRSRTKAPAATQDPATVTSAIAAAAAALMSDTRPAPKAEADTPKAEANASKAEAADAATSDAPTAGDKPARKPRARRTTSAGANGSAGNEPATADAGGNAASSTSPEASEDEPARKPRARRTTTVAAEATDAEANGSVASSTSIEASDEKPAPKPRARRTTAAAKKAEADDAGNAATATAAATDEKPAPKPRARRTTAAAKKAEADDVGAGTAATATATATDEKPAPKPRARRTTTAAKAKAGTASLDEALVGGDEQPAPKAPAKRTRKPAAKPAAPDAAPDA